MNTNKTEYKIQNKSMTKQNLLEISIKPYYTCTFETLQNIKS